MATLKERYKTEVVTQLKKDLGIENLMRVPRVRKVIVNMGIGIVDKDQFQTHVNELARITGQKPVVTHAKKSISNFKLREGMSIGAKVTLRGARMYDFLERFISATLPRIRDFRGLPPQAFDAQGNYTLGLKEQTVFPEIDPNHMGAVQGMNITIVMDTGNRDESRMLLKALGIPFAEK